MEIENILALAFLISIIVNAIHWWLCRAGQLFCFPNAGWPLFVWALWLVAASVLAVVFLAGACRAAMFLMVGVSFAIASQVYSIGVRYARR